MKKLIFKLLIFSLPIVIFFSICIALPATPKVNKSLLFAKIHKDDLLQNTPNPRLIFIGGSNLSFGLNSQMLKDSLKVNPINTGISASIGLTFMLKSTLRYVKTGDIVVAVPEYTHYYNDYSLGNEDLFRTILDVKLSDVFLLNFKQIKNLVCFIPKYSLSKINPEEYKTAIENEIYSVNSFNSFGDAFKHWNSKKEEYSPYGLGGIFNQEVISELNTFRNEVEAKGAIFIVSFPCYQATSYNNSFDNIKIVETELIKNKFKIMGSPERYAVPDSLTFNTPYHLIKKGVDYRTQLVIKDLISTINR
jgi:hypothetical protein